MKFDCNINLNDFLTDSFEDCPDFQFQNPIVNFDKVRLHVWSQLRSVDGLRVHDNQLEMYELSTFEDLVRLIQNQHRTEDSLIQILKETIENGLLPEYREKFLESLLLLSILGIAFNGKEVIFKIGVCIKRRKDIFFYDKLKRILKKHLAEKLQFLLPSEGNDKVIVFLTGKVS